MRSVLLCLALCLFANVAAGQGPTPTPPPQPAGEPINIIEVPAPYLQVTGLNFCVETWAEEFDPKGRRTQVVVEGTFSHVVNGVTQYQVLQREFNTYWDAPEEDDIKCITHVWPENTWTNPPAGGVLVACTVHVYAYYEDIYGLYILNDTWSATAP